MNELASVQLFNVTIALVWESNFNRQLLCKLVQVLFCFIEFS